MKPWQLNDRAARLLADWNRRDDANVSVDLIDQAEMIDCGVNAPGSWNAARMLTQVCLAGLGHVEVALGQLEGRPCPRVLVELDDPSVPCLLSQYAGWKVGVGKFFAMGSGPMRAVLAKESVFREWEYRETPDRVVGVLETSTLPNRSVIEMLCAEMEIPSNRLALLVARTASLAGSFQVVARSVETCLHKLHELKFDVRTIRAALGGAFLPPIPRDDFTAIGRTNDSILYGGEVCLWVDADDEAIETVGPRLPSSASGDYGAPFAELFQRYDGDFYKIDPMLFSPALVVVQNLRTGSVRTFGMTDYSLVARSFGY